MGLRRLATTCAVALVALAVSADSIPAADPPPFKATSHRRFDDVEHWTKVFDDPSRDQWQRPQAVVEALALRPGMTVADLGAGTGYFSRHLAAAVGPNGTVLAIETEPNLVVHLRERAEKESTANVVPVLASRDNPRLPWGVVQVLLIVDTFHHIDDRRAYFERLTPVLAREARIAVIDWKKTELPVGPDIDHKLARAQVVDEMKAAGFHLVDEPRALPYQYFLIFSSREP